MKNTVKLKAMLRIAGIIAIIAVIGFSMAACDNDPEEKNPPTVEPENAAVGTPVFDNTTNKWNVEISWEAVAGATGYLVGTNGTPNIPVTGGSTTTYTVSLFALTRYTIVVAAVNADGTGPASAPQYLGSNTDGTAAIPINLPATLGLIGAPPSLLSVGAAENEGAATWTTTNIVSASSTPAPANLDGRLTNYLMLGGSFNPVGTFRVQVRDNNQDANYPLIRVVGLVRGNHVGAFLAPASSGADGYTFVIPATVPNPTPANPNATTAGTGNWTLIVERTGQYVSGTSGVISPTSTRTEYQLKVFRVD